MITHESERAVLVCEFFDFLTFFEQKLKHLQSKIKNVKKNCFFEPQMCQTRYSFGGLSRLKKSKSRDFSSKFLKSPSKYCRKKIENQRIHQLIPLFRFRE